MVAEWVHAAQALVQDRSPLRALHDGAIPIEIPRDALRRVGESFAQLCEGLESRLSVVVMGEVKAGKSTLVNALAGAELSPSNMLEATATILEVDYAQQDEAELLYHDGTVETGTVASIHELLQRHRGDADFFARCRCVRARLPIPRLRRLRLVDTPGLNTVTEANARVALEYVQKADVVLWVLSALHLGQSDVTESLSDVAKLGKPIVIALNRIDQVDGKPERLARHARRDLGMYALDVIPVSAAKALEAALDDDGSDDASGLPALVSFLESEVQAQSATVKADSARSSAAALLRVDGATHLAVLSEIEFLRRQLSRHEHEVALRAEQIAQHLKEWLRDRVETELLAGVFSERRKLTMEVVERHFTLDAIEAWWRGVQNDLADRFAEEWETSEKQFIEGMKAEFAEFERDVQFAAGEDRGLLSHGFDGMVEGMKVGTLSLIGLSGYVASLSPAIGLFSVASVLAPWAIIPAVVGGAALKMAFGRAQGEKLEMAVRAKQRDIQDQFVNKVLKQEVFPALEKQSAATAAQLQADFETMLCGAAGAAGRLEDLERALRTYTRELDLLAAEGAAGVAKAP